MTFKTLYARLLTDPDFGKIMKREDQYRDIYLAGLKRAKELCLGAEKGQSVFDRLNIEIADEELARGNRT